MDKRVVLGVVVGCMILLVIGVVMAARQPQGAAVGDPTNSQAQKADLKVESSDWRKGKAEVPVEIVEYADYQCPSCAAYYRVTKQLLEEMPDKVTLVFRAFPLTSIHDKAWISAKAAEAAGLQGKFWEMHDKLFEGQSNWSQKSPAEALKMFEGYATEIGLDTGKWNTDLESAQVEAAVKRGYDSANSLGLNGTPTFFVNGVMISLPGTYERFRKIVEQTAEGMAKN